MAKMIPLTNFVTYMAEAKAIRRDLCNSTGSPAAVRKAVEDLADLAAKAMEEAAQVFEGLTMTVLALHPDVTRAPQREKQRHDRRRPAGPESVETDPVPVAEARELRANLPAILETAWELNSSLQRYHGR